MSLPSRERGLKWFIQVTGKSKINPVAPLAGAWVEIQSQLIDCEKKIVAPLAGAWVEICFVKVCKRI